jgi:hypothetical protein
VRVAADALVNLSPSMIREFCWPVFRRLEQELGKVLVHYCPAPGQKYYHVLKAVLECDSVLGVDTSGGVDYFDSPDNPMRLVPGGTLFADCAFASPPKYPNSASRSTNINRFQERELAQIEDWLLGDFMQLSRSGKRGLVLRTSVNTVEEGRELFAFWQHLMAATKSA